MIDLVRKIDNMRIQRGWTIYSFANLAGITQQTDHQWIEKDTCPSVPNLYKICEVLKISVSELFSENNLIEVTNELKDLYDNWCCLNEQEQQSIKNIIKIYNAKKIDYNQV